MNFIFRASELAAFALVCMWLLENFTDWRRKP
jgi:hypothetical protein